MKLEYIKNGNDNYQTIRQVLKQEFKVSANLILKLKKAKQIYLNSVFTYLDHPLVLGDLISVNIDFDEDNSNILPTRMDFKILFEDDYLLAVDKPAGIPVHPSLEHYTDSLSNGIKYYFDKLNLNKKIRPINRLDRNTSGIVIFAKNEYVQERLSYQMKGWKFNKEYIAICNGIFKNKTGIIDTGIARKHNSIIERHVCEDGQKAITEYTVLEEFNNMSKVLIKLKTGRTHQIRVHMAYIGHSIVGDDLYGSTSDFINRQALHAYKVSFVHPVTNKLITLISDLPGDIKLLLG